MSLMEQRLLLIGASGHGKVCCDIAEKVGYKAIVFLDDDESLTGTDFFGYKVEGTSELALNEQFAGSDFFVAIGNAADRRKIIEKCCRAGLHLVSLIHPSALIARNVHIVEGTAVMAGAVVNPDTVIGSGCIINTGVTIDHDSGLEDFVHVAVGAHLCGTVTVGENTWIGAGAVVSNNVSICDNCVIGAGAVVLKDIKEAGTYIGIPARKIGGG